MHSTAPVKTGILGDYFNAKTLPAWGAHLGAIVTFALFGFSWSGVLLALAMYYSRMFLITGVYHRYFSHKTYKTSRWFQFVLAFLGGMCAQKGALWWAAHHRTHHKTSDTVEDPHSMKLQGFWWSHMGWIFSKQYDETEIKNIPDLARYPELRWLDKWHLVPVALLGVILYAAGEAWAADGGWWAVGWGLGVSTVALWHGTFTINSLSHKFGKKRFESGDESRNSWVLAIITMGEGWHNNHHYYMNSANQGFYWWEIDPSYYILKAFEAVGLVWDVRKPPQHILDEGRARDRGEWPMTTADELPTAAE